MRKLPMHTRHFLFPGKRKPNLFTLLSVEVIIMNFYYIIFGSCFAGHWMTYVHVLIGIARERYCNKKCLSRMPFIAKEMINESMKMSSARSWTLRHPFWVLKICRLIFNDITQHIYINVYSVFFFFFWTHLLLFWPRCNVVYLFLERPISRLVIVKQVIWDIKIHVENVVLFRCCLMYQSSLFMC